MSGGKEKKNSKKYSRRAFLKSAARVGAGASLWTGIGYLTGKTFDYTVKPAVDSVLEVSNKINDVSENSLFVESF